MSMTSYSERADAPSRRIGTELTPIERWRFWIKVLIGDECWEWQGALDGRGYGNFGLDGGTRKAYRVAFEDLIGQVPEGLELDHLCRNHRCVKPAHLEPVTHRENGLRGEGFAAQKARQTHCVNGHLFDEVNTRIRSNGTRHCRACDRDRHNRDQTRAIPSVCAHGHELLGDNLYIAPNGGWNCRPCQRVRDARHRAKRRLS